MLFWGLSLALYMLTLPFLLGEFPALSRQSVSPLTPPGLTAAVPAPFSPLWRAQWTHPTQPTPQLWYIRLSVCPCVCMSLTVTHPPKCCMYLSVCVFTTHSPVYVQHLLPDRISVCGLSPSYVGLLSDGGAPSLSCSCPSGTGSSHSDYYGLRGVLGFHGDPRRVPNPLHPSSR